MRLQCIIALLTLVTVSYVTGAEQNKHLFILSGQSNMLRLNPATSFTPAVESAFGTDHVIVVKDAEGGQSIQRWYKKWKLPAYRSGDLYDRLMAKVNEAIKDKQLATITVVWMQGESDATTKNAPVYAASLQGLLDQFRTDLGRKDINFVIGRINDYQSDQEWEMVRKAQVEVAEANPHTTWINTDDLNEGKKDANGQKIKSDLHYSIPGYKLLGQRFADSAIKLITRKPNKPDASDGK